MKITEWNGDNQIIVDFYKTCDYEYHPKDGEKVIVAQDDNKVFGVVRLSWEDGLTQLRGMQIHPIFQGKGIGKEMLKEVEKFIKDNECYLVGYPHLEKFYGLIGFKTVSFDKVPLIIKERYSNAKKRFPKTEFCIMKKIQTHLKFQSVFGLTRVTTNFRYNLVILIMFGQTNLEEVLKSIKVSCDDVEYFFATVKDYD